MRDYYQVLEAASDPGLTDVDIFNSARGASYDRGEAQALLSAISHYRKADSDLLKEIGKEILSWQKRLHSVKNIKTNSSQSSERLP